MHVFDKLDSSRSGWEEEAAVLVEERARARNLELSGEASELFTLLTGGDTRQIDNELEKLDLYLGPDERRVDAALVRSLVPMSRAGVIFELGNAISRRDLDGALKLIGQLLYQGESAIGLLLVAIVPTVRNLLLVKDLQNRYRLPRPTSPFGFGKSLERLPEEATAHLPRKKDGTVNTFGLGFAAAEAHRFGLDQLRDGMSACLHANVQLVTGQLEPRLVLERAVIGLLNLLTGSHLYRKRQKWHRSVRLRLESRPAAKLSCQQQTGFTHQTSCRKFCDPIKKTYKSACTCSKQCANYKLTRF